MRRGDGEGVERGEGDEIYREEEVVKVCRQEEDHSPVEGADGRCRVEDE